MTIGRIQNWFCKAVPQPNEKNLNVQLGCHLEEVAEMIATLVSSDGNTDHQEVIKHAQTVVDMLANDLKSGQLTVKVKDPQEFVDALADQIVTATGCGHMTGMNMSGITEEVARSNESKFDHNGDPIFNENGKIMKGPNYTKPRLKDFADVMYNFARAD